MCSYLHKAPNGVYYFRMGIPAELRPFMGGKREIPKGGMAGGQAAYWLPLIALFMGARREEIGQLRVCDVKRVPYIDDAEQRQEVWCIDITDTPDDDALPNQIKNEASNRLVPLHPKLIELGFIEYVEKLPDQAGRVFPDLKPIGIGQKLTDKWGQWFSRYKVACGITDKAKVFHSFRHTWKTHAVDAGIPERICRQGRRHIGAIPARYAFLHYRSGWVYRPFRHCGLKWSGDGDIHPPAHRRRHVPGRSRPRRRANAPASGHHDGARRQPRLCADGTGDGPWGGSAETARHRGDWRVDLCNAPHPVPAAYPLCPLWLWAGKGQNHCRNIGIKARKSNIKQPSPSSWGGGFFLFHLVAAPHAPLISSQNMGTNRGTAPQPTKERK